MRNDGEIVALLPMKGHSARVPGKNFRILGDKPLFAWILDTLLSIPRISRVVINTDALAAFAELGYVADRRVMFRERRPEICGDDVSMNIVLADDIAAVPAASYLMTHATNPFVSSTTLRAAIDRYDEAVKNKEADSLFSVNRTQTRFYRSDSSPINHDPKNLVPTQDLEPWFEENSNFYLFSAESFACTNARIGAQPIMFEVPRAESMDIDVEQDWTLAELIAPAFSRVLDGSQPEF